MMEQRILRCNVRGLVLINVLVLLPAVVVFFFFPFWSVAGLFLVWLFAMIYSMFHFFCVVLHENFLVVQYPLTPWRARCIPKGAIKSVAVVAVQSRIRDSHDHHFDQGLSARQFEPHTAGSTRYRIDHYLQITLADSAPLQLANFELGTDQACHTINHWLRAS